MLIRHGTISSGICGLGSAMACNGSGARGTAEPAPAGWSWPFLVPGAGCGDGGNTVRWLEMGDTFMAY